LPFRRRTRPPESDGTGDSARPRGVRWRGSSRVRVEVEAVYGVLRALPATARARRGRSCLCRRAAGGGAYSDEGARRVSSGDGAGTPPTCRDRGGAFTWCNDAGSSLRKPMYLLFWRRLKVINS
ncbi:unnamed protein product, partial [Urochloa humidicola]